MQSYLKNKYYFNKNLDSINIKIERANKRKRET